ncbi:unnamed protein product [Durusdinium trenchii]
MVAGRACDLDPMEEVQSLITSSTASPKSCVGTRFVLLGVVLLSLGTCSTYYAFRMNCSRDHQPDEVEILEKMLLYQKMRLLRNLSDEEFNKNHVDVTALPATGPLFWRQKETRLIARNLGFSTSLKDGEVTITRESSTDVFVRVSLCMTDVSLMTLKLMAAMLSLEASIHVCNLPTATAASSPETKEFERVWLGNRRLLEGNRTAKPPRRLAFNIPASSVQKNSIKEARMSCASQINGMISSLSGVSQYISDSIYTCPPPNEVKSNYPARCSMGISLLIFGLTKSAAALSDIAVECKDPTTGLIPYAKEFEPGREEIILAACLNNIGQGMSYLARVGYELNTIATAPGVCPKYPSSNQREVCMENIGSLLADIGQVATYFSAAASGCGAMNLVPYSCASRIAGTITGLFDTIQAVGAMAAWCDHPGVFKRNISARVSEFEEKVHNARYQHTINLN